MIANLIVLEVRKQGELKAGCQLVETDCPYWWQAFLSRLNHLATPGACFCGILDLLKLLSLTIPALNASVLKTSFLPSAQLAVWDRTVCSVFLKLILGKLAPFTSVCLQFVIRAGSKRKPPVSTWDGSQVPFWLQYVVFPPCSADLREGWTPKWRHSKENSIHLWFFFPLRFALLSVPWHNPSDHTVKLTYELWRQVKPVAHLQPKKPQSLFSKLNYSSRRDID